MNLFLIDMSELEKAIMAIVEMFEVYAGTDEKKSQLSKAELGQLIKAQLTSPEFKVRMRCMKFLRKIVIGWEK